MHRRDWVHPFGYRAARRAWMLGAMCACAGVSMAACGSASKGQQQPLGGPLGAGGAAGNADADGGSAADGSGDDGGGTTCTGDGCSSGGIGECAQDSDCSGGKKCSKALTCIDKDSCATDGDCKNGEKCNDDKKCAPGGDCGSSEFKIERVASNVIIVLDRSCSMGSPGKVGDPKTKWQIAIEAIVAMTTNFSDSIRWGLEMFPDKNAPNCASDGVIDVPVAEAAPDAGGTKVQALLTGALNPADPLFCKNGPCVTNIDGGISTAATDPALVDPARKSYMLLLSDGAQSGGECKGTAMDPTTAKVISDMNAKGVSTFVLGFGTEAAPASLNLFANAGGVPRGDPAEQFYRADDSATLDAALAAIAGSVSSCDFGLEKAPENVDELFAFLDKEKLARDPTHADGWDYDEKTNQVSFYGATCEAIKSGVKKDIQVIYGCDVLPAK